MARTGVVLFADDAFLLVLLVPLSPALTFTLGEARLAFISRREDDEDERCD